MWQSIQVLITPSHLSDLSALFRNPHDHVPWVGTEERSSWGCRCQHRGSVSWSIEAASSSDTTWCELYHMTLDLRTSFSFYLMLPWVESVLWHGKQIAECDTCPHTEGKIGYETHHNEMVIPNVRAYEAGFLVSKYDDSHDDLSCRLQILRWDVSGHADRPKRIGAQLS